MKSKSIIPLVILGLFIIVSCEKLEKGPMMKSSITPPTITAPTGGTSFIITEATQNDTMTKFTWNAPDYGFQAAVIYTLQITITGDFKDANDIGTTHKTKLPILNSKMNSTLLILGAEPAVSVEVKFRIKAVINDSIPAIYSETGTINVTPFEIIIIYPKLYVPGDYQGWSASDENTVISSVKSDEKYEGYLYFNVATSGMKFLKVPAWEQDNTIGDPDASGTSGTLQIGNWGGNNINVSGGPGYFKINANLVDKTYSWVKTDWGLIGSATPGGWNTDSNMTYDLTEDVWTVTVDLVVGDIKFRANAAWDFNLGDNNGDKKLQYNGNNIPVAIAGNYTITLDLGHPVYKYKIIKN